MPELNSTVISSVVILILISVAARTIHFRYFEEYFKLTFEGAPFWNLFYFGVWALIVFWIFPNELSRLFGDVSFIGYLALVVLLLIIFPAVYRGLRLSVGNPEWLSTLFPGQGMLTLEERYIFAKIGDVVFQQFLAGALLLVLLAQGFTYPQTVIAFFVLFTLAHLYLFRTAGFVWGLHYTAYAALAGFAFPFLIVFIPGGIVYAIVLHMLFYVLTAAFFAKLPYPAKRIRKHLGTHI